MRPQIPRHIAHRAHDNCRHRLPLKLRHQVNGMCRCKQHIGGIVIIRRMDIKVIALRRLGHQRVKGGQIIRGCKGAR